jgi:hypothetical protein
MDTKHKDFALACLRLICEVSLASAIIVTLAFGAGVLVGNMIGN